MQRMVTGRSLPRAFRIQAPRSRSRPVKACRSPGQSPGIFTVVGDFAFADDDTYTVEIGGTSPGNTATDHDQIDASVHQGFGQLRMQKHPVGVDVERAKPDRLAVAQHLDQQLGQDAALDRGECPAIGKRRSSMQKDCGIRNAESRINPGSRTLPLCNSATLSLPEHIAQVPMEGVGGGPVVGVGGGEHGTAVS